MSKHFLRGLATLNFYADDVLAARAWYEKLFGIRAYFAMPEEAPAYIEFRIGDDADEFGIIDRKYGPKAMQKGPGGAVMNWHVDDLEGTFKKLIAAGATVYEPITPRSGGFITASVVDPFGNVLGIMTNPHFIELHGGLAEA